MTSERSTRCRSGRYSLLSSSTHNAARLVIWTTLALSLCCPIAVTAQAAPFRYRILDRGPSLVRTLANTPGFNNRGELAIWNVANPTTTQGLLFREHQLAYIDGDPRYSLVYPSDLTNEGAVVGLLQDPQDTRFTQGFLWYRQQVQLLPTLGGRFGEANAVNQSLTIVGSSERDDSHKHATLWRALKPLDLGTLSGGDFSSAQDVNAHDHVVGSSNTAVNGSLHAFLWENGAMRELPIPPGGSFCSAQALNDRDDAVGYCDLSNGTAAAILWRRGGQPAYLGTLGDDDSPSTALDINGHNQVVGCSEKTGGKLHAFLWEDGRILDLNAAIDKGSGWVLITASRINDRGQIAGRGYYRGAMHAFVLDPVPLRSRRLATSAKKP